MDAWQLLVAEALTSRTGWLLLALSLSVPLVWWKAPEERGRLRRAGLWLCLHLLLVPVAAYVRQHDPEPLSEIRLALLFFGALSLIEVMGSLLVAVLMQRLWRAPLLLRDVLVAGVAGVAFFALASRAGLNLSGLIATSAVLTAVIGLSLQDTLGNVFAGLALQIDQSLRVGDWIKQGDVSVRVSEIRWRSTSVETRNWETVVVPNSVLVRNQFVVAGRREREPAYWRRWVYFNVDFRYSPPDVTAAVEEMLLRDPIPNVALEPRAHCLLMELGESFARYAVRYWLTDLGLDDGTDSLVRARIFYALRRAEIPLSMPAHAVFLTEDSPERRREKDSLEHRQRLAALSRVGIFEVLPEPERERLAEGLRFAPFLAGEVITRQGDQAHWLYMVLRGEADVRVRGEAGQERLVAQLKAGDIFGEMALLTGAPRSATVTARTGVECYRLDKQVFAEVLKARPELAEPVAGMLAQRSVSLQAAREQLDAEGRLPRVVASQTDLLSRIRDFFGLEP